MLPLDMLPDDMLPDDMLAFLAFFFLGVMAVWSLLDIAPLDMEPLDMEPFDIEPLDIEPLVADWAKAPVAVMTKAAAMAEMRFMGGSFSRVCPHHRGRVQKRIRAEAEPVTRGRLNSRVPFIAAIFPIAAAAAGDMGEAVGDLDPLDIFGLLVAKLPFHP